MHSIQDVIFDSEQKVAEEDNPDEKRITSWKEIEKEELVVLWTSGDPEVATKMLFMYTYNAKKFGWWDKITLIVWGPSAKLLSETTNSRMRSYK